MAQAQHAATNARMPAIGDNPLQRAYDDYHIMENELLSAKDRMRSQDMTIVDLMRESDFTRSQLAKVTTERDRLQAYAIDLTTRLAVIGETIASARSAAMQFAIKPATSPADDRGGDVAEAAATKAEVITIDTTPRGIPAPARGLPVNQFG